MRRYPDDLPAIPLITPSMVINPKGGNLIWTPDKVKKMCEDLDEWMEEPSRYFITRFFVEYGITQATFHKLLKEYPALQDSFDRAKDIQEVRLVELAVSRRGDPTFIKFILSNKNNWKEKQEISGEKDNPLALIMDRIAQKPNEED